MAFEFVCDESNVLVARILKTKPCQIQIDVVRQPVGDVFNLINLQPSNFDDFYLFYSFMFKREHAAFDLSMVFYIYICLYMLIYFRSLKLAEKGR